MPGTPSPKSAVGHTLQRSVPGLMVAAMLACLPPASRGAGVTDWPLFRGDPACTGVVEGTLPEDLEVVWEVKLPKTSIDATAIIADGKAFVGDFDGVVHCLALKDGREIWKTSLETILYAAAAYRDGLVFVGDGDGRIHALDAASGAKRWSYETGAEINSSPNFYQGNVIVGSQDAVLYCLEAKTGNLVWKHQIKDMIQSSPAVVGNITFLLGCDGVLHIIDLDKGEEIGGVEISSQTLSAPAIIGDRVYFGTNQETVFGVDWRKREIVWTYRNPARHMPFDSSPAATADVVIIGGDDKSVHGINSADGSSRWMTPTRGRVESSPVIVGQRVFVGSVDGRLYGLDLATGEKVWEYDAGGAFVASPAVAEGRLVIGNQTGSVFCFGKPTESAASAQ